MTAPNALTGTKLAWYAGFRACLQKKSVNEVPYKNPLLVTAWQRGYYKAFEKTEGGK